MTAETFGSRLRSLTPNRGDLPDLARKTGIPVRTITRWASDQGEPQVAELAKIADAAGVALEWLVYGRGSARPGNPAPTQLEPKPAALAPAPIDFVLMGRLNEALRACYKEENVRLDDRGFGELLAEKYEEIATSTDNRDERLAMIKLTINLLRKDLRSGARTTAQGNGTA